MASGEGAANGLRYNTNSHQSDDTYQQSHPNGLATSRDVNSSVGNDGAYESDTMYSNDGRPVVDKENGYANTMTPRDRSRTRTNRSTGGKSSSGTLRVCRKCNEPLTGQFVRALGGTFHLDCFKCKVSIAVANEQTYSDTSNPAMRTNRGFEILSS